jgi:hypothetical protein
LEKHHILHWFDAHGPDGHCEHQFLIGVSQQAVKTGDDDGRGPSKISRRKLVVRKLVVQTGLVL